MAKHCFDGRQTRKAEKAFVAGGFLTKADYSFNLPTVWSVKI
jgi:hypothetical protein